MVDDEFKAVLAQVTGGRRYFFIAIPFGSQFEWCEKLRSIVSEVTGCSCIRCDDLPEMAHNIGAKVRAAIDESSFVIGEISEANVNVYYEIGYATAIRKQLLLMARKGIKIPADLEGVELIRYEDSRQGSLLWQEQLRSCLAERVEGTSLLLKAMLLPSRPDRSIIVTNPMNPSHAAPVAPHPPELRTYGDYLGIAGIFTGFASFYGENFVPEVVSGNYASAELLRADANLYLIGSPKVNSFTRTFLEQLQSGPPAWKLEPIPGDEGSNDPSYEITGTLKGVKFSPTAVSNEDWGLVVRGPHPHHPSRIVFILAGARALGTGSACMAATKSELIGKVRDALGGDKLLGCRDRTIWVLVKGTKSQDGHLDASGVEVIDAGSYPPRGALV